MNDHHRMIIDVNESQIRSLDQVRAILDGEAGFDPDDTASVAAAIAHVEATIDAKVARFQGNALVREAAEQIKVECRANILAQVDAANTRRGTRTLH